MQMLNRLFGEAIRLIRPVMTIEPVEATQI
jgi:hypothetical protein